MRTSRRSQLIRRHTVIRDSEGIETSQTVFVLAHLPEDVKEAVRFPHTLVDSQLKFKNFCLTLGITGYTRIQGTSER